MTGRLRETDHEFTAHEGIAMRFGRTDQRKGVGKKRVSCEDRGRFVESLVNRGFAAPQVIIVHRGQIVMHQRIGMHAFHGRRDAPQRTAIHAEQRSALDDEKSTKALAAAQRRIAHRFQDAGLRTGDRGKQGLKAFFRKKGGVGQRRFECGDACVHDEASAKIGRLDAFRTLGAEDDLFEPAFGGLQLLLAMGLEGLTALIKRD